MIRACQPLRGALSVRFSSEASTQIVVILRIFRFFRKPALVVGSLLLLVLIPSILIGGLRFIQIQWFYQPAAPERSVEKARYLESIPAVDPAQAPSFVVILFDDLGWGDLSSYGNRLIRTPAIDTLADQGVRLTDFYAASPVCTPSRAALLTGRFPIRSGTHQHVYFAEGTAGATVRKMLGIGNEFAHDEIVLPEILGAAGYATGMVGKWHLGSAPGYMPNDYGFDSFYGVLHSNDMQPLHIYRNGEIEVRDTTPRQSFGAYRHEDMVEHSGEVDQSTLTTRYTQEAIRFLEANRERPFLLYLAHTAPHVPHFPDRDFAGQSEGGRYGDVVEDLDRSTGAIAEALDRLGLSDNTLLIVTSDNGADYTGSSGPLRGRKGSNYEGGQRVPLIARWPGHIPAGTTRAGLSMNFDLFPTLVALAGLPLPDDREIDGADMMPMLTGRSDHAHDILYYMPTVGSKPAGARDTSFKYIRSSGDPGRDRPHLTRLDADAEAHDLHEKHPDAAARLQAALDAFDHRLETNPRGWN